MYSVEYENQCDLKVFKVGYPNQANGNEGLWYFVDYPNQSDKKIYFVDYSNQSDLKIFFVKYKNQSGWRDKFKQHLMYQRPRLIVEAAEGDGSCKPEWSLTYERGLEEAELTEDDMPKV